MDELFEPPPAQWGTRGDPHAWARLRELMAGRAVPATAAETEELLAEGFRTVVGVDLRTEAEDYVYRKEFAHGGMSSGTVHLPTWRDRLIPLLVGRAVTGPATPPSAP